jgi:hypothetical protein
MFPSFLVKRTSDLHRPAAPALDERVVIRHSTRADAEGLRRLALLDDRPLPEGELLVAEVGGEIVAARSLAHGAGVADPFRRTLEVRGLLELRASQLQGAAAPQVSRPGLRRLVMTSP